MTDINWHERAKSAEFTPRNMIGGEASEPEGDEALSKYTPYDGSFLYEMGQGTIAEVERAVVSARETFQSGCWRLKKLKDRQRVLNRLAELIDENRDELALMESLEVGKPIHYALKDDVPGAASELRSTSAQLNSLLQHSGAKGTDVAFEYRKALGVVGAIIGWNYPLLLAVGKLAPALAMGNSLVLKPSEFTPLSACRLATLALEAGVPPGVFNVVNGHGPTVGAALAEHADVNLLAFTGSTLTGKEMLKASGNSNMKGVILECGGKSPYIVFDDYPGDLDWMVQCVLATAFANQGALCVAGSRLLVQKNIKDVLIAKVLEQASKLRPQHPLDKETRFGAIMNEAHMNKVLGFIDSGRKEGGQLLCGGAQVLKETGGFFIEPTIFDKVGLQHSIAQKEIFGPVLSVFSFKDEAEAVSLANSTPYGLASYVATKNLSRAVRVSKQLDSGVIYVRGGDQSHVSVRECDTFSLAVEPHKQSGFGREGGLKGLESYSVCSAIHMLS